GLVLRCEVAELGWHIALVMLGEDRIGHECPALEPSFRDGARTLAEQVWGNPAEHYRSLRLSVRDEEAYRDSVARPLDGATFDHSAEAHRLAVVRLAPGDIR